MAADNNYKEILEEVVNKLDSIDTVKEVDVLNIKEAVEELGNLMTDSQVKLNFQEIKEKLESLSLQMDNCNESLLKDIYTDINKLKDSATSVNQYIENLQNIQNLALTSAEFEEYQKQQLDLALKTNENIFNELSAIKENSSKSHTEENIQQIETSLVNLHKNLTGYIEEITSRLDNAPNIENISAIISDFNGISQKNIKETNSLLKKLQLKFESFQNTEFQNQFAKISEIYDSITMINAWIEKVGFLNKSIENVYSRLGANIDFDEVSDKVDIIYENISALNNWTMKIDTVDESIIEIQSKISALSDFMQNSGNISEIISGLKEKFESAFNENIDFEDLTNKIDIVYENLSSINTWANKVDSIDNKINSLENLNTSVEEIKENVSNINNVLDEDMISSKIDIIYENITLLNKWINKIDDISKQSEELDNKFNEANSNLNEKIDQITKTLSDTSDILVSVPDIKEKLEKVSTALNSITHSSANGNDSYIYSLLDIESDFLKLHKFLDDNTKNTSQDINALKDRFEELNDDISSISVRTNKLILSADDANKEFKTHLESFKDIISLLNKQRESFNPELKFNLLGTRLTELVKLMKNNLESNKNINTAFIYLAEWIDATGRTLNGISNDIEQIKSLSEKRNESTSTEEIAQIISNNEQETNGLIADIKNQTLNLLNEIEKNNIKINDDISEIKSLLTGIIVQLNTALTPDIDSLNERIDKLEEENNNRFKELEDIIQNQVAQQAKQINSLEAKIDDMTSKFNKLIEVFAEDNKNYEIKDILNYIASQTSSLNEAMQNQQNANAVIDTVAEKLTSFDENINKIVSYIEEE